MALKLVTFDFWQTLLAETPASGTRAHALRLAGVTEALDEAGHRYQPASLTAADTRTVAALEVIWREHRDVPPAEQVRMFLTALDPLLPDALSVAERERVEAAYAAPVLTYPPVIAPGALEAVRQLAARGFGLGVISNTGRTPGTMLRRLLAGAGMLDAFCVLSFSDEVGVRKPAAAIFHRTLALAGCEPGDALHVGDDPVSDVGGARAVGMHALHYVADGRPAVDAADGTVRHFGELPALVAQLG